jgi:hypothetical protein
LPPSLARLSCELGISVGMPKPHDFAVRLSHVRLTSSQRPSHSASRSVTIGYNALCIEAGYREPYFWFTETIKKFIFSRGAGQRAADEQWFARRVKRRMRRPPHDLADVGFTSDRHSQKTTQPSSELSVEGGSSADIFLYKSTLGNCVQLNNVWYDVTHRDGMSVLDLVGDDHEIAVKLRRALSYRSRVNRIAV